MPVPVSRKGCSIDIIVTTSVANGRLSFRKILYDNQTDDVQVFGFITTDDDRPGFEL